MKNLNQSLRDLWVSTLLLMAFSGSAFGGEDNWREDVLKRAGENHNEISAALDHFGDHRKKGMEFLVRYMPEADLQSLTGEFLIENVEYAYVAREKFPWAASVPEEVFFNDVIPYASIDERRDPWRKDFFEKFAPLVEKAGSCEEASQILNRDMFKIVGVQYHATKRPKPNQSPYESMEAGYASCSGLSVLLIDACRAVGVPARFAGTPRWAAKRGNHSWVEVWDNGWHFTGACEFNGDGLNKTWFTQDAAQAIENHPWHAIYASSWKKGEKSFPLIWNLQNQNVEAVDVTSRYSSGNSSVSEKICYLSFRESPRGERIEADITVFLNGESVAKGRTAGSGRDLNDVLTFELERGTDYTAYLRLDDGTELLKSFTIPERGIPWVNLLLKD